MPVVAGGPGPDDPHGRPRRGLRSRAPRRTASAGQTDPDDAPGVEAGRGRGRGPDRDDAPDLPEADFALQRMQNLKRILDANGVGPVEVNPLSLLQLRERWSRRRVAAEFAAPPAPDPDARLRFARWLVETGRLSEGLDPRDDPRRPSD